MKNIRNQFMNWFGYITIVGLIIGSHLLLSNGIGSDISNLSDKVFQLSDRVTRIETVIDERLPKRPTVAEQKAEKPTVIGQAKKPK